MPQDSIQQLLESAVKNHRAGRFADAEKLYREILRRDPNQHAALNLLGVIARDARQPDAAIQLMRRAIAINSNVAGYHLNLGNSLRDKGQIEEAIAAYHHALKLDPNFALAHYNLGNTLLETELPGRLDESIAATRHAIRLDPNYAYAYANLALALHRKGSTAEAIEACRKALALKPDYADVYTTLANTLSDQGDYPESVAAYRQAIHFESRISDADFSTIQKPLNLAAAHYNFALVQLLTGDFANGWIEHEWRLKDPAKRQPGPFTQPRWIPRQSPGQTILLSVEQGMGDVIQFARFAPLIDCFGARPIIQCHPELARLLRSNPRLGQIVPLDSELPPFDFHYPLMSLPLIFKTDLTSIPSGVPYLFPEPSLVEAWSKKISPCDGRLRVGLAWAGNPRFKSDATRSLVLEKLAPFFSVRSAKFHSLQKGSSGDQAKNLPARFDLVNLGPDLSDFADTAAVMSLMDLIITTDTSVAHLAGALARPTWAMLQFNPDWRWLLHRDDSPWYPTIRLFRQNSPGDWPGVIARVAEALATYHP